MSTELSSAATRVLPFVAALFFLWIGKKRGGIVPEKICLVKPGSWPRYFLWCVFFIGLILLTETILFQAGLLEIDRWNYPFLPSLIRIIGAVILAPVVEEVIFRGVLLSKLHEKLNLHTAIAIQAVLFVLAHSFTYQNTLSSNLATAQTLMDGLLYGYARRHTRSLYTPMTMHMIGNFAATAERFLF